VPVLPSVAARACSRRWRPTGSGHAASRALPYTAAVERQLWARHGSHLCAAALAAAITVLAPLGCTSVGPASVQRDRFDYNTAVANSWKEQTLLNIIKLRYADMPIFVEVASIVAGYTLEGNVRAGATFPWGSPNSFDVGGGGKFTDRPTITYQPIMGQQFNKSFMTPIPPAAVLFLLQTGWQAELVIPIAVDSVNGLLSRDASGMNTYEGDPEFYEVVKSIGRIQRSNGIGMQVLTTGEKETTMFVVRRERLSEEAALALADLDRLLGLDSDAREFEVVYRSVQKNSREIAMLTRSMLHIMIEMAGQVDVPEQDITEGRTIPSTARESKPGEGSRLLDIRSSAHAPKTAFVAVRYRDRWFYIDDRDYNSKRSFTFLMLLNSLLETGGREGLPLVTIPS